jgi:BirA family transcriptional regulator, biotin operon repressor / biotin---[acetyl-CoA-carboxylase] ligase
MTKGRIKPEAIVGLLRENEGYLSGVDMASRLGVTRAAVWKAIGRLKKEGYVIESSPGKGYLLLRSPDLCAADLKRIISTSVMKIGRELLFFDSVSSTNSLAMELASQGCVEGTIVIADSQTTGKGRLGRSWISPPAKNLYMSIVLRPEISPRDATALTLLSAVACASAIRRNSSIALSIKWPNDLIIGRRKIGGILTEIKADIDRINYAVVGIGINVNMSAEEMPDDIKDLATSLMIERKEGISRTELAADVIMEFDRWYGLLMTEGKKVIIDEWLAMSSTIGKLVHVATGDRSFEGVAEGIDDEGLLIVKQDDGTYRKVSAGDVTMVRTKS